MQNIRIEISGSKVHPDFTIRHAHLSRVSTRDLESLRTISDFCIGQVNGRVTDTNIESGSQYFIEDHTDDKRVREIFESYDTTLNDASVIKGVVSFSREDLVEAYETCLSDMFQYNV